MLNNAKNYHIWEPSKIFSCSLNNDHATIILNTPIKCNRELVRNLWKTAKVRLTVDGGTDQWLNFLGEDARDVLNGKSKEYLPNLVTGDMDSISGETLERLKLLNVNVILTEDQNETDYTKSLRELNLYCRERDIKLEDIYVVVETCGRFDQSIATVNTLHKSRSILGNVQIVQISSNSLTILLEPGMHRIIIPEKLKNSSSWCALLPIGYPAKNVSTTGLKWNLDKQSLEMAGLVSSSNTYCNEPHVTVSTDVPLVWTMGIETLMSVPL